MQTWEGAAISTSPLLALRIEEVGPHNIEAYAELSRAEYGDSAIANPAHLRWKFLANPAGASVGIHLFAEGRLIGRLVAQPRQFMLPDGSLRRSAYMVDLLIHPHFRGMPSLTKLMTGMRALREDFDFVIVTPNAAGIKVWATLQKMPECFEMRVALFPLRPGRLVLSAPAMTRLARASDAVWRFLTRRISGALSTAVAFDANWPDDEELCELTGHPDGKTRGRRDVAFLRWRFLDSPVFKYKTYFLRRKGRLVGYIVTRRTTYAGYRCTFIVDVMSTHECSARDWMAIRWKFLNLEVMAERGDIVLALGNCRIGALSYLARFPMVPAPARLLPQRTPLFAEHWTGDSFPIDDLSFAFTLADCDMI